ncbi:MAG: serine/threonine protein kinase, partial [Acidobacteria bacterium]|nr:serine/threonine protein kinase [Acidobacteriota bacterium]
MASPTEFRRLEALFHEIADLAADARRERLAALAADEPEVHAQLVRLLESDPEVTSAAFAPREPVSASGVFDAGSVRRPEAGDRLGPYRLVRELAQGGMGVVFEAEQEAPLVRRVAVKLVRDDLAGPRILERFEAERSSVARMSHPAIAQVFDAGATPEGRPFLVMELVAGEPITAFCDRERLSTSERIRLFLAVCDAVRHAHQKGILHRDLKPGNVLVASGDIGDTGDTGEPRVKVIDFGISKLVADEEAKPGLTRRGEIIGTPEYMSPEQARGEEIDTRSDVYALGVLLLELLTGRVPLADAALERASPLEIARRIESAPRLAPEALLPADRDTIEALAARRRSDPVRLRRELRGDLGLVLGKATHPEIERRYSSVEQLAADLGRYLAGHPIEARPDSVAYRARRFVARHTAGVVAAALVFATLVAATLFSTRMFLRADAARGEAETQRAAAERISAFLQEMLGSIDPQLARGRDVSLLRNVLDDAAGELEAGLEAAPAAAADIRLTIGRTYAAIGAEAEAEEQLRASLAQLKALAPPRPEKVAAAELALGSLLHNRDRIEEAEKLLRSAVARNRSLGSAGEAGLLGRCQPI